jgi:MYXO-CTERM domain-containing protein
MSGPSSSLLQPPRGRTALALLAAVAALVPGAAHAHFQLQAPACYSTQDALGSPQKSAPCGQADPGVPLAPTGAVTAYIEGGMITVTINEIIFHPGHYRISIAQDQGALPADPPVTAGSMACGSTTIATTPALPLLADGVMVHTAPFSGPQTVQIPLPAGFTCTNCVLQVVEFMSDHGLNNPGGCFYHHCATVSVLPPGDGGTGPADSGNVTPPDGATGAQDAARVPDAFDPPEVGADGSSAPPAARSCGCRTPGAGPGNASLAAWFVLGLGAALARRRRRRTR